MKKIVILFASLLSLSSYAQENPRKSSLFNYQWKSQTDCKDTRDGIDAVYPERGIVTYSVCPDGTISHRQPRSHGLNGWEGYCGQTAASNMTSMLCQRHISPKTHDLYAKDLTPGQHSSTMKKALNKIFSEQPGKNTCPVTHWVVRINWHDEIFLEKLKRDLFYGQQQIIRNREDGHQIKITPIPVLMNSGGLNYHWVTVVDLINNSQDRFGCDVIMNTWGNQKTLGCETFTRYTDHTGFGERVYLNF